MTDRVTRFITYSGIVPCDAAGVWDHVPLAPEDPILGLNTQFNKDTDKNKVNLGVGAYRTAEGKPYVLECVKKAEQQLLADPSSNHEYIPIDGLQSFVKGAQTAIFGANSAAVSQGRVASTQVLSGTGALRVAGEFIARFFPKNTHVLISDPTWGNHFSIFKDGNVPYKTYRYYNSKTNSLDFEGMIADISNAPDGSIVLLHSCAHNPTGVDPSMQQWEAIADLCAKKKLVPFFDSAYQGFSSGDLEKDAASIRYFLSRDMTMIVAQSFAKNMGLYGERVGALHFICSSAKEADHVLSQLKLVIRPMYSSPPKGGAAIAALVLNDPKLYNLWKEEMRQMAGRMNAMRKALKDELDRIGAPSRSGNWNHVVDQIGMFSYTGLTAKQCASMIKDHHIYLTSNGRISIAGLNDKNVAYVAAAMKDVLVKIRD